MARSKQDFDKLLAIIAHDIKAPLSSIISLIDLILKGYVKNNPEKTKEISGRVKHKAALLISMLDDMLDYSLMANRSDVKKERINFYSILDEAVNMMKPYADQMKISLNINVDSETNDEVCGNRTFLLRALNNLIMNAIKYNTVNGKVEIFYHKDDENKIVCTKVKDTGIGMDEEDLSKMFQLLQRGKNAKKNIDGSRSIGLGMSLVKEIINSHRGTIEVFSKIGEGTTIKLGIPIFQPNQKSSESHFCSI